MSSMKQRLAILAAVSHAGPRENTTSSPQSSSATLGGANMPSSMGGRAGPGSSSLHGNVNVLLGGAMLSGVILIVFFICYCCHRNMRKNSTEYNHYWRESLEAPLEIYTLAGQGQNYETAGLFLSADGISCTSTDTNQRPETPGPPPAYESVVSAEKEKLTAELEVPPPTEVKVEKTSSNDATLGSFINDDSGLPTYEAALKLEANGYV